MGTIVALDQYPWIRGAPHDVRGICQVSFWAANGAFMSMPTAVMVVTTVKRLLLIIFSIEFDPKIAEVIFPCQVIVKNLLSKLRTFEFK